MERLVLDQNGRVPLKNGKATIIFNKSQILVTPIKTINGKGDDEYCVDIQEPRLYGNKFTTDGLVNYGVASDYELELPKEFDSINCKSNYDVQT